MSPSFPNITHIDDIRPHIEGYEEITVADRGDHVIVNYNLQTTRLFGSDPTDHGNQIRRECRGLIFDKQGNLVRRPLHKFFNVGEREETLADNVDFSRPHSILPKLDGSMIAPYRINGETRFGTKMGQTDIAREAEAFAIGSEYLDWVDWMLDCGYTPIFEWMSPNNRVVINYGPFSSLVLIAVRNITTGAYLPVHQMSFEELWLGDSFRVSPIPPIVGPVEFRNLQELIVHTAGLVGEEGFVVRFDTGDMVKVKSSWYVALHKIKEQILFERNVALLVLDEKADDVSAALDGIDRERLQRYTDQFNQWRAHTAQSLGRYMIHLVRKEKLTRKEFALNHQAQFGPFVSIVFTLFDVKLPESALMEVFAKMVDDVLRRACHSNTYFEQFKSRVNWPVDPW